MSDFFHIPESIECEKADVISRKIIFKGFLNDPCLGYCTKYVCDRNSSAEIMKELNPKVSKCNPNSKLNLGDKLDCESLFVLITGFFKADPETINHSGRHKAQKVSTKKFTYAEITRPFEHIANAAEKKKLKEKQNQALKQVRSI